MTSLRLALLAALTFGLLGGCAQLPKRDGAKAGPFFTPANVHSSVPSLPANIRRVLLLPLSAPGLALTEENLARLDATLLTELTRTARFEVVALSRDQLTRLTGARQIDSTVPLPAGFIDRLFNIYNDYAADALLFVDLTAYSPYPPLTLGLRTKLAHIRDSDILWATDLNFSATDPAVANSARRHALTLAPSSTKADLSHTILQNPTRFASYAAATTFETLPPRVTSSDPNPPPATK
jgi:hypothetical protein